MIQNKFYTALFFIIILFLLACQNNKKVYQPTSTIIEGQFTSIDAPVVVFQGKNEIKVPVDPQGKFLIDTKLEEVGVYKISFGYENLLIYLVPGDKVSVTGDVRTLLTGTRYTGDHAIENNFLLNHENLKLTSQPEDYQTFFSQGEDEFIKSLEKRTNQLTENQQEYQKQHGAFDKVFAEILAQDLVYDEAIFKLNYPQYFKYFNPDQSLKLSETYDSFLQNAEIDADQNLMVPSYKTFLASYIEYKSEMDSLSKNISVPVKKFNIIDQSFQSPDLRSLLFYELMFQTLDMSINDAVILIPKYNEVQKHQGYKTEINNRFQQWSHLVSGKPAPNFTGKTPGGKSIALSDLNGKLVYIDVWATWCGPCLRELPHLEKLQNDFKRNDVTFLSISIDENKSAWINMVREKSMKGLQIHTENAWSSPIVTSYMISGIPRFILIGKDGNIINANAPRPFSTEIRKELSEALGS